MHERLRRNILIVDDDPGVPVVLERLLGYGYEMRSAQDGRTALLLAGARRPDLVLLDVSLPDLDGLTVLRELHRFDPDLRVLMLTGDLDADTVRRSFEGGAFGYLTKPFSADDIAGMVEGALMRDASHVHS